ncbi:MAG: cell division protein FtsA [Bryobacter sp.]
MSAKSAKKMCVGVDAGSAYTRVVVCQLAGDGLDYLGHGVMEAKGWQKGRVADQSAITESIRWAVQMAETHTLISLNSTTLGLGGGGIDGMTSRGVYEFGRPRQVDSDDMNYAIKQAAEVKLEHDRMILQVCPQDFIVDGRSGFMNPKGMPAHRLEAHVHLITSSEQEHTILANAIHEAHLALDETLFEGIAAAYACTTQAEREHGLAVIDIGAQTTEVVLYEGEALVGSFSIPIGGDHFTRDLAHFLASSREDAQVLKEEFGCALLGLSSGNTLVEVPGLDGRPPREISRWQIAEILEARAEQLFEVIKKEVHRLGMLGGLEEGVVLCGGGAKLPGMLDIAERVLQCASRNGIPEFINRWPAALLSPEWTTAAGLAMYGARLRLRREMKRRTPRLLDLVLR